MNEDKEQKTENNLEAKALNDAGVIHWRYF
jgi:hypothetical protein